MSVKSSFIYVTSDAVDGEGASVHIYTDVTTDKILMDLSYGGGAYGTQLGVQLGSFNDEPLVRLLKKIEAAIDRGTRCARCGHNEEHEGRACGSFWGPAPERRCPCETYAPAYKEPQNGERVVEATAQKKLAAGSADTQAADHE